MKNSNADPLTMEILPGAQSRKSGRAAFTDDGRSIWEWQTQTGVFTRTITDAQLVSLEATDLCIQELPEPAAHGQFGLSESMARMSVAGMRVEHRADRSKYSSLGRLQALLRRLMGAH